MNKVCTTRLDVKVVLYYMHKFLHLDLYKDVDNDLEHIGSSAYCIKDAYGKCYFTNPICPKVYCLRVHGDRKSVV